MASRYVVAVGGGVGVGLASALLYRGTQSSGRFMSDGPTDALAQERKARSAALDALLRHRAPMIEKHRQQMEARCGLLDLGCRRRRAAASNQYAALRSALRAEAAAISYGADAPADAAERRDAYVREYGCVAWTGEALDLVAAHGRDGVVEVGAGHGQWARALAERGVDVLAFDDGSSLPMLCGVGAAPRSQGREAAPPPRVAAGVDGAVAAAGHPTRTLLLVAPPPGGEAARWLGAYRGGRLVYAGEGRGGAHADEAFFASLERGWRLAATAPLKPFPGGAERLWVLERRS